MKILELFAGIRASYQALKNLGVKNIESVAVEFDKKVVSISNKLHNENTICRDVVEYLATVRKTELQHPNIVGKENIFDLIIGGSPCQDISNNGKRAGAKKESETRSSHIWDMLEIVKILKPKFHILENVEGILHKKNKHVLDYYCAELAVNGYNFAYKVLNSINFGIPQNRPRLFLIAWKKELDFNYVFPQPIELKKRVIDYLEEERFTTKNYETNDFKILRKNVYALRMNGKINENSAFNKVYDKSWKCGTLTVSRSERVGSLIELNDTETILNYRFMTPREQMRLMGWKDEMIDRIIDMPKSLIQKVSGNSMVIQVMEALLKPIVEFLGELN